MKSTNIVAEAAQSARRAVLAAVIGASVLVTATVAGSSYFCIQHEHWTLRVNTAHAASKTLNILIERESYAAQMAAATGKPRWIEDFREMRNESERAFAVANTLATQDFDFGLETEVRPALRKFDLFAEQAFEQIAAGRTELAKDILDDPDFAYQKRMIYEGMERFADHVHASVERADRVLYKRVLLVFGIALPLALAAAVYLWQRLNTRLSRSVRAYLAAETQIQRLALTDALTGLSNRISLLSGLRSAMARARGRGSKLAVLMMDLDRFKPINDLHGHLVGDQVLKEVANRLGATIRNSELCGRFGGDEFVAVVEYEKDDEIPRRVGRRVVDALSRPMVVSDLSLEIGASVGIAIYPTDSREEEDLISKADMALYRAKADGRLAVRWFASAMDEDLKRRATLEAELRAAIAHHEIVPYYQPLIELKTGAVIGFEVLARWHHQDLGEIPPATFIPIAERTHLIDDIMMSLLRDVCRDSEVLPANLTFAMNVSPLQIQDMRLAHRVLAALSEGKIDPSRLEIELTETALVSNLEAAKTVISGLKSLGIKVALDDFGTGYSSLAYLSELSFDRIKIDRSFIKTMHGRQESVKIISAIVSLSKSLGVPTTAEGVESARDEDLLRAMGCTVTQGFYYSKPLPISEVPHLLARLNAEARAA